ncbi:Fic family protein [Corynebacterium liangguodongii]|uniref:Addiction module protein n=1 Tax=Corynebacterium liangguodongii TaxID=2079535 RepID=A0A2S0WGL7_9CORY|nr:addiction module protein [Corynebacterium liangguodongii]PWB99371.1 Fic family protein [Corynebacterium liangguodongii]
MNNSEGFAPDTPYNDLPPLPPPVDVETAAVLKDVIEARAALAALNTACDLIPNPEIITSTIPLREAQASTEIENIVTTNDELFKAEWEVDPTPSPATKEALRYKSALYTGVSSLDSRPVSEKTAVQMCSILSGQSAQIRSTTGTVIGDPRSKERIYTPPEGQQVIERHLSAWERFIYSPHGLDPLVLMAVTHYQFEAIHPFYDGNGRTGRILNILLLIQLGVLRLPVLYLSGYIVDNKSEYYALLRGVTARGDWEAWVRFMVRGVQSSAESTTQLIDDLRRLQEEANEAIRALGISAGADLAHLLFLKPYVRIADVVDAGLAQRQTASAWLNQLAGAGILAEYKVGRSKVFANTAALGVLTRR